MKALLYCNKNKPYLVYGCINRYTMETGYDLTYSEMIKKNLYTYNGFIAAECDISIEDIYAWGYDEIIDTETLEEIKLQEKSNMTWDDLDTYLKPKYKGSPNNKEICGYAIHLSNINIFEEPTPIAPSYTVDKDYVIIKCSPKELCNILNDKQTILIRKRVLKELIK